LRVLLELHEFPALSASTLGDGPRPGYRGWLVDVVLLLAWRGMLEAQACQRCPIIPTCLPNEKKIAAVRLFRLLLAVAARKIYVVLIVIGDYVHCLCSGRHINPAGC